MDVNAQVAVDIMIRTNMGSASSDMNAALARIEAQIRSFVSNVRSLFQSGFNPAQFSSMGANAGAAFTKGFQSTSGGGSSGNIWIGGEQFAKDRVKIMTDANSQVAAANRKFNIDNYNSQIQAAKDLEQGIAASQKRTLQLHENTDQAILKSQNAVAKAQKATDKLNAPPSQPPSPGGSGGRSLLFSALETIAVLKAISLISELTTGIINLGVESVKQAARFELMRNAMILFTGSATNADKELGVLTKLAENTAGLRFDDALRGAAQLRALGFEAKVTQDLVVGLAKQKLISGVDDEGSIQRVLINLQQLRAGSPQILKDVQQMVLALPSLSIEIGKAFGSIQKFRTALQADPQAAIDKLAESMAKAEAPAGGLTNAVGKLEDEVLKAGIAFGTPLLEPLMRDAQDLTLFLRSNKSVWAEWGQFAADAVRGVTNAWYDLERVASTPGRVLGLTSAQGGAGIGAPQSTEAAPSRLSQAVSQANEGALKAALNIISPALGSIVAASQAGGADRRSGALAFGEYNAAGAYDRTQKELKAAADKERLMQEESASAKQIRDAELQGIKENYASQEKLLDVHHRFTAAQELQYTRQVHDLKEKAFSEEYFLQLHFFDRQFELNEGDQKKDAVTRAEMNKTLASLNAQRRDNDAEEEKRITEIRVQEQEKRRQAALQANQLDIQAATQAAQAQQFMLERQIEFTGKGYDALEQLAMDDRDRQIALIKSGLAIELQDRTLSKEQIANLERKADLDIIATKEKTSERVLQIEDQARARDVAHIQANFQRIQAITSLYVSGNQSVTGLLGQGPGFGRSLQAMGLGVGALVTSVPANDFQRQVAGAVSGNIPTSAVRQTLLQDLQAAQMRLAEAEVDQQQKILARRQAGGSIDEIAETRSALRVAELKRDQLKSEQGIARYEFEQSEDLTKINQFTKDIADGTRDALILDQMRTVNANNYQKAVIAQREQQVLLGNAEEMSLVRQTKQLEVVTALRQKELDAVFAIDAANIQIADQTTYHANQANASVLQYMASQKGVTQIMADFKTGMLQTGYDYIDKGLDKVLSKMGAFGTVIRDLISSFIKLLANAAFRRLFGLEGAGGTATGPGGASSLSGILNMILGGKGGASGASSPTGALIRLPDGSIAYNVNGNQGAGIGPGGGGLPTNTAGYLGLLGAGGAGVIGVDPRTGAGGTITTGIGAVPSVVGKSTKGIAGFLNSPAFAAAFAGLGIGASLGQGSTAGTILGGVGGILAGVGTSVAIGGSSALGSASGILGTLGIGAGAFAAATLGIGAGLAVLAFILGRRAREKKEKQQVAQLSGDALAQVQQLIADVKAFKIDGASAYSQGTSIRDQFAKAIEGLKSGGGKQLAQQKLGEINALLATLKQEGDRADRLKAIAAATDQSLVPTFASGGYLTGNTSQLAVTSE
jgi:hypothetical protein